MWRGGKKCKCRISGVRKKKMEFERKVPGKKIEVIFWMKIKKMKDFAKFVFTGWALC